MPWKLRGKQRVWVDDEPTLSGRGQPSGMLAPQKSVQPIRQPAPLSPMAGAPGAAGDSLLSFGALQGMLAAPAPVAPSYKYTGESLEDYIAKQQAAFTPQVLRQAQSWYNEGGEGSTPEVLSSFDPVNAAKQYADMRVKAAGLTKDQQDALQKLPYRDATKKLAEAIGYKGPLTQVVGSQSMGANEGGYESFIDTYGVHPDFADVLKNYRFAPAEYGRHPGLQVYDATGKPVSKLRVGDGDSKFDKFMEKAIPIGLGILSGGALAGPALAALGVAAPGAIATGAATGSIAGGVSTLAQGGDLKDVLKSALVGGLGGAAGGAVFGGSGGAVAPGASEQIAMLAANGLDDAAIAAMNPTLAAAGGLTGITGAAAGAAGSIPAVNFDANSLSSANPFGGGMAPVFESLPAIGAEATAFGGLPDLSALGGPAQTAFGSFGGSLLAPQVAAPSAFNPGALETSNPFGGGLGPVAESIPAIGAETTAFGGLPDLNALAGGAAAATPFGSFSMPVQSAPSGLLGTAKDAAAWLKENPLAGRLLMGGATSLLSGAGGGGSSGAPQAPSGPPVQWNSGLQKGLLAPVNQYAPAAVQQNRPAGLLAQGYANDGAWRYLGG